ncbi:glycoside hydrolase family 2 [soil metagenome]
MNIPRPEYPRPQFVRPDWLCLNGEWEFEIDAGDSGWERGLLQRPFARKITVPFCPESRLSGIGITDFLNAVWYRRRIVIPLAWTGRDVLLHFQAVDYDATVWVNGTELKRHRGGCTTITCELKYASDAIAGREIEIVVRARDTHRGPQPRGKQSEAYANAGCLYTRTTGIWQTVWLEPVPTCALLRPRITPDMARHAFRLEQRLSRMRKGLRLRAVVRAGTEIVAEANQAADQDFCPSLDLPIPSAKVRPWSPRDPFLYSITIELVDSDGAVLDQAESYAGLRSITISGLAVHLNDRPVFQRLVLDQGYYEDGILTAPTDQALIEDIVLSLAAGFNGARLHQKVFEERFLFHADQLGYLVWGEFPDWGCGGYGPQHDIQKPGATYITQWLEVLERDYSHPSIIGWCPTNEITQKITDRIYEMDDVITGMFHATRLADRTRPILDASGYSHRVLETDIYDSHDYTQNPADFLERHSGMVEGRPFVNQGEGLEISTPYRRQPYFVSEFGGIWWNPEAGPGSDSWGYGDRPQTEEEFYTRFEGLCSVLLDSPGMFGYCYTQLTDVYQEQNGLYRFNRSAKFDLARLRAIQQRRAAIEDS